MRTQPPQILLWKNFQKIEIFRFCMQEPLLKAHMSQITQSDFTNFGTNFCKAFEKINPITTFNSEQRNQPLEVE